MLLYVIIIIRIYRCYIVCNSLYPRSRHIIWEQEIRNTPPRVFSLFISARINCKSLNFSLSNKFNHNNLHNLHVFHYRDLRTVQHIFYKFIIVCSQVNVRIYWTRFLFYFASLWIAINIISITWRLTFLDLHIKDYNVMYV